MVTYKVRVCVGGLLALVGGVIASAHVDDPKERDREPPYIGPAYRSGEDFARSGPEINFPRHNVDLLAWLPVSTFGSQMTAANVVEGYVSPSGREYAIIGLSHGTGWVEVTDPSLPVVVAFLTGPTSSWRDIRTYGHYCYAVSEAGQGIQVFNMQNIDSGQVTFVTNVTAGPPSNNTANTHTMFINQDSGFLYRAGGGSNGLRIYSLANPALPTYVATWPDRYVHEVTVVTYTEGPYAGKEIAFACGGFNGGHQETGIDIIDVTNKSNLINLSRYQYPQARYSHQGWLSPDKKYFYLNDELDDTNFGIPSRTRIIDVQNLAAPFQAGYFESGAAAIDHNLYVKGNLIFESNYRSGLRVFDASNPLAPVQVAWFDTYPQNDNPNFNGLWDNYPFLPSGIVLGSDIEKGLFIWRLVPRPLDIEFPNGRPEMMSPNGGSIPVTIASNIETLEPGSERLFYNTGSGFVGVHLSHVSGDLYHAVFPAIPCVTHVKYYIQARTIEGNTIRHPPNAPGTAHHITFAAGRTIGFEDDMETNTGWVVGAPGDNATQGIWVRVDPNGTVAQPEDDHTPAPGVMCWVTGQGTVGGAIGAADVDGGCTSLTSPVMNATAGPSGSSAYIEYYRWFSNNLGPNPNGPQDVMTVRISNDNGNTWTQVEVVSENAGTWVGKSFKISDFVTPTSQVRIRFTACDMSPDSVVEAGVDDVRIAYYTCQTSVPGDITGDGLVNVNDLLAVINAWGPCPSKGPCPADISPPPNGDGVVNVNDLLMVINHWSPSR